jgi:DNA (cytosine-5)-methyltransferase 1
MQTLTKKQKIILDYINDYREDTGISPTIEEIKKKLKLNAVSTVHAHIKSLIKKGFLTGENNKSRSLSSNSTNSTKEIPIIGIISAGQPIEPIEYLQNTILLPTTTLEANKNYYALKVSGDSMIDEGIFDGDVVVIKNQVSAENGQTVVAIIDNGLATLKKIYREKNRFKLQPANQQMLPFYRDEVEIRGVVIQVIRNINNNVSTMVQVNHTRPLRTLDLFAGIGGIRLGFENAGFQTVFSNDFDEKCKYTYDANFVTSKLVVEDIKKINIDDLPEFDFLLAGFPCQSFSIAGYREGFNDKKGRGNLFFDIARIIEARKPMGFMLENVKNLTSHDNGNTFNVIKQTLKDLGYFIKARVLNTMEYGNLPQNRERIYIIGFRDEKYLNKFSYPDQIPLTKSFGDLLENEIQEKYYYNGKPLYDRIKNDVTDTNKVYQWRRKYVRENKKGVCPTLTANMGMGGHNVPIIKDKKGIRKLTPLECARIQGFPYNYKLPNISDSSLYKQIGNSVSVTVIERIAKKIMESVN